MANGLRVCGRYARARIAPKLLTTWENVSPLLTGGQVVAGSNPVSPTENWLVRAIFGVGRRCPSRVCTATDKATQSLTELSEMTVDGCTGGVVVAGVVIDVFHGDRVREPLTRFSHLHQRGCLTGGVLAAQMLRVPVPYGPERRPYRPSAPAMAVPLS